MELLAHHIVSLEMNIVEWINYHPKVVENQVRYGKWVLGEMELEMLRDRLGYKSIYFILRKPSKHFAR